MKSTICTMCSVVALFFTNAVTCFVITPRMPQRTELRRSSTPISHQYVLIPLTTNQNAKSDQVHDDEGGIGQHTKHLHHRAFDTLSSQNSVIGRRRWIRDLIVSAVSTSISANADGTSKVAGSPIKAAVCDGTVESYRKGSKQIHVIGTAHVSSISAQLAGSVVKEIKVFIALVFRCMKSVVVYCTHKYIPYSLA